MGYYVKCCCPGRPSSAFGTSLAWIDTKGCISLETQFAELWGSHCPHQGVQLLPGCRAGTAGCAEPWQCSHLLYFDSFKNQGNTSPHKPSSRKHNLFWHLWHDGVVWWSLVSLSLTRICQFSSTCDYSYEVHCNMHTPSPQRSAVRSHEQHPAVPHHLQVISPDSPTVLCDSN